MLASILTLTLVHPFSIPVDLGGRMTIHRVGWLGGGGYQSLVNDLFQTSFFHVVTQASTSYNVHHLGQ